MSRVTVAVPEAGIRIQTDDAGMFQIESLPPGDYRLIFSTVGFRLLGKRFSWQAKENLEVDVALTPEALERKDSVDVHADLFHLSLDTRPTAFALSGTEAHNLASVLADDPMRALQATPGVSSNDDFDSRFSIHGAPYDQVGLYLDGILLHQPFHTVQGLGPSGSTAIFNGDMVSQMSVETEGYGSQYENRIAGAIDVQTREGSTDKIHVRLNASLPSAGILAEGPWGKKASWLVSERKSYLQYFLKNLAKDVPSMAFGFMDTQGQFNYRMNSAHAFSLNVIDGNSSLDNSNQNGPALFNTAEYAGYHYTLASAGWQFTPSSGFLINTRGSFTRERFDDTNFQTRPLSNGSYGGWTAKSDATWLWSDSGKLQLGLDAYTTHGSGVANYFFTRNFFIPVNSYAGKTAMTGGYAQQSFSLAGNRLSLSLGGRWDGLSANHQSVLTPQASIAYMPWSGGRWSFAWGRYAQFPDITYLYSNIGNPNLSPMRSQHLVAAFEQRLGTQSRIRVEAFQRDDKDLLFQPFLEARLTGRLIVPDHYLAPFRNSLSGVTKGAEIFIQKRTANGWTGWISYTFSRSEMHDALANISFPSDQDQRHTVNAFVSYRLRPSVNLSSKFSYGSGFPVPGFFSFHDETYYIAGSRNAVRVPAYQRLDIRLNKSKMVKGARLNLFVEVVNVFNHDNYRFDSYNGYTRNGQAFISLSQMFPILPSAGMTLEF